MAGTGVAEKHDGPGWFTSMGRCEPVGWPLTGCGGLLIIDGDAAARPAGISMKGHRHSRERLDRRYERLHGAGRKPGRARRCRATRSAISIYEASIFVRGDVKSLGTDCIEKPMTPEDSRAVLADVLRRGGLNGEAKIDDFRMYGSARRLYHFHIDNIASY